MSSKKTNRPNENRKKSPIKNAPEGPWDKPELSIEDADDFAVNISGHNRPDIPPPTPALRSASNPKNKGLSWFNLNVLSAFIPRFSTHSAALFVSKLLFYGAIWVLIGQIQIRGNRLGANLHNSIESAGLQKVLTPIMRPVNFLLTKIGFPTAAPEIPADSEQDDPSSVKNSLKKQKKSPKQRRDLL